MGGLFSFTLSSKSKAPLRNIPDRAFLFIGLSVARGAALDVFTFGPITVNASAFQSKALSR